MSIKAVTLWGLRQNREDRDQKREELENPHGCRLEHFPGILFIQRSGVGKPAKQSDCLVCSIFWTFLVNIVKWSIWLWGQNWKPSSVWRAHWYQAMGKWLAVCSQLHLRWPFKIFLFFSGTPVQVSVCKPASRLRVHTTFFSQRFGSVCSRRVVGYCSMKLNSSCNCPLFPKDLQYRRYSLNAFLQTCLWPLVHLSRASDNLQRANFSPRTFRGHVG